MGNLVLPKPKQKYWVTYILRRIKKNKNFLGFISGGTGSGKSWSSLAICESLDPEFTVERCVFGGLELMHLINSDKLKRGSAIVFEEAGVEMSNKNWASVTNKMLNYLMQTFRHKGFILIMNSPYMDFVDSTTRKLFHAEMSTQGIDFNKCVCKLKPQLIQYNSRLQKFYYKRLRVIKSEGVIPIDVWNIDKPSKELIQQYEQKKSDYTKRLNKKILIELDSLENKGKKKKELTEIQQETLDLLKQGLNVEQISTVRNRDKRVIRDTMILIKKKGYKFNAIHGVGNKVDRYEVLEPESE